MIEAIPWYVTRSAGIVSLVLLTAATCLGLLTSARWQRAGWPRFLTAELHRTVSLLSVAFLVVHIVVAAVDPTYGLGIAAVLLPFASSYRELWLTLGVVSLYLGAAVVITSLFRSRIGLRSWRLVHLTSYAAWPLAVLHSMGTGTDSVAIWLWAIYAACIVSVAASLAWRVYVWRALQLQVERALHTAGNGLAMSGLSGTNVAGSAARLLEGPDPSRGAESLSSHLARLGALPRSGAPAGVIAEIERSGLLGRGGAAFPVGTKWRHVAERRRGAAVVVANGAEGEPRSLKDRTLMGIRPHLVIDGAVLAARAVAANEVILYVGAEHAAALAAMSNALGERQNLDGVPISLVAAPFRYVSGESSAVVHYLNEQDARPVTVPPRPWQHGVDGSATIVQNVESLAHAALIGRFGAAWYRSVGRGATKGTVLTTVLGTSPNAVVREIELGTPLRELVANVGGDAAGHHAVLLGGYFGGWSAMSTVIDRRLDPVDLAAVGASLGCGLVALLPAERCGVRATASILRYMAAESARQCGPCIFGLGAMASALQRLAATDGGAMDVANLQRWATMVRGRGACHHPDGAAGLVESSLRIFGSEYELHARRRCSRPSHAQRAA